jgi:dihydropteroate synthase
MGILNLTPDSFSDGGQWLSPTGETKLDAIVAHAQWLIDHGCTVLDVGGESTRPGAATIPLDEELSRVVPVIQALHQQFPTVTISIDTRKASVAEAALHAGACIINDVSGLRYDPDMVHVAADSQATLILMHSQGTPETMQQHPTYIDVVAEVKTFLQHQTDWAIQHGVQQKNMVWDVGFGFGKTVAHNLQLLSHLGEFTACGFPVLLGTSRKSFLALGAGDSGLPQDRDVLTAATVWQGAMAGCSWFRIHNPQVVHPVLALAQAMQAQANPLSKMKETTCV